MLDLLYAAVKRQYQARPYIRTFDVPVLLPYCCRLPATEQLEPRDVTNLLMVAVQTGDVRVLDMILSNMPTAREVDEAAVKDLLAAAVKTGEREAVEELCLLKAARRLQTEHIGELLAVAAAAGYTPGDTDLLCLPGYHGLDASVVAAANESVSGQLALTGDAL